MLTTMLGLRERGLPLPAAGVLMSPWTDLAATGESYVSRAAADPIHQRPMITALAKDYLGEGGDPRDPHVSPLYADLAGLPPLLIKLATAKRCLLIPRCLQTERASLESMSNYRSGMA